jgi:hypothetical protein
MREVVLKAKKKRHECKRSCQTRKNRNFFAWDNPKPKIIAAWLHGDAPKT